MKLPQNDQGVTVTVRLLCTSILITGFCLVNSSCSSSEPRVLPEVQVAPSGESTLTLWADWDDLNASVGTGLTPAELPFTDTSSADDRRTWSLLAIDNHVGELVVTRDPTAARDSRGCERLTLTAHVDGPQGRKRAGLLVSGMAERLKQLAGVDWAPRK